MGLFSSKKIYRAYAGSASLYEEQPATLKSNILQQAIGNEGTMSDAIMFSINTDTFARAKAMMRYARRYEDPTKDGGYVRGFPEANLNLVTVAPSQIEAALTRAVGDWDEIVFMKAGDYDEVFMVEKVFQEQWPTQWLAEYSIGAPPEPIWHSGLSEITIPVVNPDTGQYYLANNDIQAGRVNPDWDYGDLGEYGGYIPPSAAELANYKVSFPYTDKDGASQVYEFPTSISIEPYITGSWIQVRYLVGGVEKYWVYEVGSGGDPDLEAYIDEEQKNAEFLPVAVLMHDRVWFDEEGDAELEKTTNRLLKKMGTTGTQIKEDFLEAEEENPSQGGDKWDFFVHFAVPIQTKVRGAMEYLWYFFSELEDWESFKSNHYYDYLASATATGYSRAQPVNEINITEAGVTGYNVDYRWSFIETKSFTGFHEVENTRPDKYGPDPTRPLKEGEVTKELYERELVLSADYQARVDEMFGPGTAVGRYTEDPDNDGYHDIVVLWRQRKEDELEPGDDPLVGRYDQMLIMGLSMQYRINTAEIGVGGALDNRFRYSVPELFGDEEETKEFRIPILYGSLEKVPTIHREEAVADGFTATVFLVQRIKVKWYQRNFFKWLLVIVAIVLIIYGFYNPEFLQLLATSIAGASSGFVYLIVLASLSFAMGWIISQAATTIGAEFGRTAATIFMVFAMAMSFAGSGGLENLDAAFSALTQSPGWATAVSFINAAYPIYQMGYSVYADRVLAGLEDELRAFEQTAKEKQQELQDAWDSLGPMPDWIDPMDLVNMFRRVGSSESANSYLNRVLNPNPGVLGIDAISQFTNVALALPEDVTEGNVVDSVIDEFAKQRGAV